jgi:hypothetical protein
MVITQVRATSFLVGGQNRKWFGRPRWVLIKRQSTKQHNGADGGNPNSGSCDTKELNGN